MLSVKARIAVLTFAVACGVAVPVRNSNADEPASTKTAGHTKIRELQKERLLALRAIAEHDAELAKSGQASFENVLASNKALAEAELELCETDKERIAVLEKILAVAREMERVAKLRVESGNGHQGTLLQAKAERLGVEIAIERVRASSVANVDGRDSVLSLRPTQIALAEKSAVLKRAAVDIALARKGKAQAGLEVTKAHLQQARAAEVFAQNQLKRMSELYNSKSIEERVLDEQRFKFDAAKSGRVAAEAQIAEAESQVTIEQFQVAQAELELEEARFKVELLKVDQKPH